MGQEIHQLLGKEKQRIMRYLVLINNEPQDVIDFLGLQWSTESDKRNWKRHLIETLSAIYDDGYYIEGSGAQTILNSLERYYQTHLKLKREKK